MDDLTTLLREAVAGRRADGPARRDAGAGRGSSQRRRRWYAVGGRPARRRGRGHGRRGGCAAVRRRPRPRAGAAPSTPWIARREHRPAYAALLRRRDAAGTTTVPRVPDRSGAGDDPGRGDQPAAVRARRPRLPRRYWSAGQLLGATRRRTASIEVDVGPGPGRPAGMPRRAEPSSRSSTRSRRRPGTRCSRSSSSTTATRSARSVGVPTSEPLANAPQLDVLALASISDPAERRVVEGSFSADGRASSFEGNVPWELRDADGTVVREGTARPRLWRTSSTPGRPARSTCPTSTPGNYTFVAMTDDPSGGEGPGPTSTRGPSSSSRSHAATPAPTEDGTHDRSHPTRCPARPATGLAGGAGRLRRRRRAVGPGPQRQPVAVRQAHQGAVADRGADAERLGQRLAGDGGRADLLRGRHPAGTAAVPRVPAGRGGQPARPRRSR